MESRFSSYLPKAKKEIVLLYVTIAALWIVLLDRLVVAVVPISFEVFRWWDLTKDLLFVLLSALTLYTFVNRIFRKLETIQLKLERRDTEHRQLFQISPVAICVVDTLSLRIRAANRAAIEQFKYSWEDLAGITLEDILVDVHRASLLSMLENTSRDVSTCLLKTKPGEFLTVEIKIQATTFDNLPAWILTLNDITRRLEAEKALRTSESLFRTLVSSMEEVVFTLDGNQAFTGVFGRGSEKVEHLARHHEGKTTLEAFGPTEGLVHVRANERALEGESVLYDWSGMLCGQIGHYQTSLSPLYDDQNRITGIVGISRDVTETRQIQIELAESELKFRNLVENSRVGIYILVGEKLVYVNPALTSIFGYSAEELLAFDSTQQLILEEDRPGIVEPALRRLAAGESYVQIQVRGLKADGSLVDLDLNGVQTMFRGEPAIIGTIMDISEQKEMERALRKSELLYRSFVEQASDSIVLLDRRNQILQVNESMIELTGYTSAELQTSKMFDLFAASDREKIDEAWSELLTGRTIRFECELLRKNKSRVYVESSARLVGDGIIQAILRDVTVRKRAETALINSEQRYRSLIEQATDGIMVNTIGGPFTVTNTRVSEMLGYTPEEMSSMYPENFITPLPGENLSLARNELQHQSVIRLEREITRKDGSRFQAEIDIGLIEGDQVQAIIRDVTQRKQAEKELKRTNRALRALSATNRTLVHSDNESILLSNICQVLVDEAGYGMAWIGRALHDAHKNVIPVAFCGNRSSILERLPISWADYPYHKEPTGAAIRTGIPTSVRFLPVQTAPEPWMKEAVDMGFEASAALPLVVDGIMYGALSIFHDEDDAFDDTELTFLAELADDVAFGISSYRMRERQNEAESALREQEARHRALLLAIPDTILRVGIDGIIRDAKIPDDDPFRFNTLDVTGRHLKDMFSSFMGEILIGYCHQTLAKRTPSRWDCVSSDQKNQSAYEFRFEISGTDEVLIIVRDSSQQRRLERKILEVAALEQRRIGQDIHDGLGQQLTGLSYIGRSLTRLLERDGSPHTSIALQLQQEAERAVTQARNLAHGLNPVELTHDGLYQALREVATHVQEVYKIKCSAFRSRNFRINNATTAYHLYRIAQEAINNAVKHANPGSITVKLTREVNQLVLEVIDDGAGMKSGARSKGMGMHTMNYRASLIGAVFQVNSLPGKGTTIVCSLPIAHNTPIVPN